MSLPIFQSSDSNFSLMQTKWAALLNPVLDLLSFFKTKPPTQRILTSGSGIYNPPSDVFYIHVRMVGGGGGGAGSAASANNNGGNGNPGTSTTFGANLLVAEGGAKAFRDVNNGGPGGAGSIPNNANVSAFIVPGGYGGPSGLTTSGSMVPGGMGGVSGLSGGAGGGGALNQAGFNAFPNTGGGGGGAGVGSGGTISGAGGGAGGYVDAIITNITGSFPYTVGTGGTGGTAGTSGYAGGNGASGVIIIREFYQ